jgi:hypothetical protein
LKTFTLSLGCWAFHVSAFTSSPFCLRLGALL